MEKRLRTLTGFLNWYYDNQQEEIMLVYRHSPDTNWSNRALFLSEQYNPTTPYNHRSVLKNEIVIEYDFEDKALNKKLADLVCERLNEDNIKYAKWSSGNKSYHVHFIIAPKKCKNVSLLKNTLMRLYGTFYKDNQTGHIYKNKNKPDMERLLPDLRLASDNHMIRAEYGVHEKTEEQKKPLSKSPTYPCASRVPERAWPLYINQQKAVVMRKLSTQANDVTDLPGFKYLASSHLFREAEDGRERAMFIIIHAIKDQWKNDKQGFTKYIQEWYRYSGGHKMSEYDIAQKIHYHWNRSYPIENALNELLESLGKADLIHKT